MITYVGNPTLTQRVRISGKDLFFLQLNNKNKKLSSIFTFEENVEEIIISSSIPSTQSHYAETGKSTRFSCQNLFSSNL